MMSQEKVVYAALARLPPLRSELWSSLSVRCEAKFRTSGVVAQTTMVDHALAFILEDILVWLRLTQIYEHASPWAELKSRLKDLLGEDPWEPVSYADLQFPSAC